MLRSWQKHLLLSVVALMLLAGAGMSTALAADSTLVIGAGAEASSLDPRLATDVPSFERIHTMMEPLISFAPDMSLTPRLAHSWTFSDDGLVITFHLHEGVMFHHGREFTSADVKYTFEWVLDENNLSSHRPLYADIASIETPDDYTVVFHLSAPNGFLINNIARMPIVPYDLGDDPDFERNPVGTGPYVFVEWRRDDRMVMQAFEDYWGPKANIETIVFRPIPEDATKLLAFEAGEIDMFQGGVVPAEVPRLEADPRFVVQRAAGLGYTYLGFNTKVGPLADQRVRQAISHLINREGIVDIVMNGIGQPGISMIAPQLPWFNEDVYRYDYNQEKAQALLREAGIEPGTLSIRLYTNENPVRMLIAEILEFELSQVGVELRVTIEEFGAYLQRVQETDDYDVFILGWSGQVDPDRAMYRQFHSQGSHNYASYSNPRVDELLDLGRVTPADSPESIEIYAEAQAIVVEEAPFAFINYTEEVGVHHAYISGWEVHPHGSAAFQDVHLVTKDL